MLHTASLEKPRESKSRVGEIFSGAARKVRGFFNLVHTFEASTFIDEWQKAEELRAASAYCDEQILYLENFFKEHDFTVAQAYLDLLKDLKQDKIRKVKTSPAILHEINQVLTVVTALKDGMLAKKWDEIEKTHGYSDVQKQYGAIESWICRKIGHDIMEDYNEFNREKPALFQKGLIEKVEEKFVERNQRSPTPLEMGVITKSAHKIETLTHYRKLTPSEFAQLTGTIPDLSHFNSSSDPIRLTQYDDQFSKLMNRKKHNFYNPYVFARMSKKGEPEIIITAYGAKSTIGIDGNAYIRSVGRDPFTAETKFGDRIDNDSTRIGVRENAQQYDKYIDGTDHLFSNIDGLASLVNYKFPKTPLKRFLKSQSKMLKLLTELGQGVVNHHPDNNKMGNKVLDAFPLLKQRVDLTTPLVLSPYIPRALAPYKRMPDPSNPLITFFKTFYSHIRKNINKPGYENLYILCHAYLEGMDEHAGAKITDKIINNIGYQPPMALLENLNVSNEVLSPHNPKI